VLTDVGSTKAAIVQEMEERLPPNIFFVGGHPLAGSEKRGPEHASARLFEGRLTLLTPTPRTGPEALARVSDFWRALGADIRVMDAEEHDRAVALTSHLPHLLASALAGMLPGELAGLTASGFRDTTRIAAGDPALWSAIFEQNRAHVSEALARLQERLESFRQALEGPDRQRLQELLEEGSRKRQNLPGRGV
jgi:prephenate dehydrogenase